MNRPLPHSRRDRPAILRTLRGFVAGGSFLLPMLLGGIASTSAQPAELPAAPAPPGVSPEAVAEVRADYQSEQQRIAAELSALRERPRRRSPQEEIGALEAWQAANETRLAQQRDRRRFLAWVAAAPAAKASEAAETEPLGIAAPSPAKRELDELRAEVRDSRELMRRATRDPRQLIALLEEWTALNAGTLEVMKSLRRTIAQEDAPATGNGDGNEPDATREAADRREMRRRGPAASIEALRQQAVDDGRDVLPVSDRP